MEQYTLGPFVNVGNFCTVYRVEEDPDLCVKIPYQPALMRKMEEHSLERDLHHGNILSWLGFPVPHSRRFVHVHIPEDTTHVESAQLPAGSEDRAHLLPAQTWYMNSQRDKVVRGLLMQHIDSDQTLLAQGERERRLRNLEQALAEYEITIRDDRMRLENTVWDEKTDTLYLIDLADCSIPTRVRRTYRASNVPFIRGLPFLQNMPRSHNPVLHQP